MLVLVVGVPLWVLAVRRSMATPARADHNHLAMARWVERQMGDDMVRCTISEDQQRLAELLLTEFYGDDDHTRRELS